MKKYWHWLLIILPAGFFIALIVWYYRKQRACKLEKANLIAEIAKLDEEIQAEGYGGGVEQEFQKAELEKKMTNLKC